MMPLFAFSQEEILCFFAVLVRVATLIAVLPITGDRFVPGPVKILMALATTITLYPALVVSGHVRPLEAVIWGKTPGGIAVTVGMEAVAGLVLGFTSRILFDSLQFGANLTGNFMGFATASTYDPHQETQTQVVAEIQLALATLVFLALDGHHLMLRAAIETYQTLGIGQAVIGSAVSSRLTEMTASLIVFGFQLAAPVAVALFAVNVAFGVLSKTMPQLNVLVLSFAASALVGLAVLFTSLPELQGATVSILGRVDDWMRAMTRALHG